MKTIVLDLDDISVLRTRWDLLEKLKEHFPKLKLSAFFIPFDFAYEGVHQFRVNREAMIKKLKENLDWIEIIPHGLTHSPREFEKADVEATKLALKAIDAIFKKEDLPYKKGFKAPFWLWNESVCKALDEEGWFGATDRNQPNMAVPKKNYIYNLDIAEPFWESEEPVWKLHGHITPPSANNLEACFLNLMKMPTDAEFKFVSEMV